MIESEANKIWESDRYNFVFSYYHKPFLPPPLIIFSYILLAFQFIVRRILQTRNQDRSRTKLNPLLRFFIDETQQGFGNLQGPSLFGVYFKIYLTGTYTF